MWAKLLFERLYGTENDDNAISDFDLSAWNSNQHAEQQQQQLEQLEQQQKQQQEQQQQQQQEQQQQQQQKQLEHDMFRKLFQLDVEAAASMKNKAVWTTGKPPEPLNLEYALSGESAPVEPATANGKNQMHVIRDQIVWTLQQNAQKFIDTAKELRTKKLVSNKDLLFDKDDDLALDFVTAAANLRATNFHIPTKSRFDVKGM